MVLLLWVCIIASFTAHPSHIACSVFVQGNNQNYLTGGMYSRSTAVRAHNQGCFNFGSQSQTLAQHCNNIGWCTVFAGPHRSSAMIYILDIDTCYIPFTVQQMNDMTTSSDLPS